MEKKNVECDVAYKNKLYQAHILITLWYNKIKECRTIVLQFVM